MAASAVSEGVPDTPTEVDKPTEVSLRRSPGSTAQLLSQCAGQATLSH